VAGQQHQVEASVQPGRSGVIEHPGYARAPAPAFRQGEHRRGRIDTDDETIRFPGQRRRQHTGAAAKIEYFARRRFAKSLQKSKSSPSHSQCRKIERSS
jgi:hypothetical protein